MLRLYHVTCLLSDILKGELPMSSTPDSINLEDWIRDIPDFPQKGVLFKDITPLLQDGTAFHAALDRLAAHYQGAGIQTVVGVESRGFIFGAPLAYLLNCGFVPVRKFGKLPAQTDRKSTRLNSSHANISYAVFCLKKKKEKQSRFVQRGQSHH